MAIRQGYDEKELKDALMDNVQNFLMELGTGFAFVGREYRLQIGSTEQNALMPKDFKGTLPTIEELEQGLSEDY